MCSGEKILKLFFINNENKYLLQMLLTIKKLNKMSMTESRLKKKTTKKLALKDYKENIRGIRAKAQKENQKI